MATIHPAPSLVYFRPDGAGGLELVIKPGSGPEMLVQPLTLERIVSYAATLTDHLKSAVASGQVVNAIRKHS